MDTLRITAQPTVELRPAGKYVRQLIRASLWTPIRLAGGRLRIQVGRNLYFQEVPGPLGPGEVVLEALVPPSPFEHPGTLLFECLEIGPGAQVSFQVPGVPEGAAAGPRPFAVGTGGGGFLPLVPGTNGGEGSERGS